MTWWIRYATVAASYPISARWKFALILTFALIFLLKFFEVVVFAELTVFFWFTSVTVTHWLHIIDYRTDTTFEWLENFVLRSASIIKQARFSSNLHWIANSYQNDSHSPWCHMMSLHKDEIHHLLVPDHLRSGKSLEVKLPKQLVRISKAYLWFDVQSFWGDFLLWNSISRKTKRLFFWFPTYVTEVCLVTVWFYITTQPAWALDIFTVLNS